MFKKSSSQIAEKLHYESYELAKNLVLQPLRLFQGDEHSLHVKMADESVCVGPAQSKLSYLNVASIMSAADLTGADAIHPAMVFLAENADFARVCEQCGIHFIGPNADQIAKWGIKLLLAGLLKKAGVPMFRDFCTCNL